MHLRATLVLLGSLLAFGLFPACESGPAPDPTPPMKGQPKQDEDLAETMENTLVPLVEDQIRGELTKDKERINFGSLRAACEQAAHVFKRCTTKGDVFYLAKPKAQENAQQAQKWFEELAAAAGDRNHQAMVRLAGQTQQICSACHDY